MRKIFFVGLTVAAAFALESLLARVLGPWGKPNFFILLIVFFNLFWGIRYSLLAACGAGVILDSFSAGVVGVNIFSFVTCAYLTTFLKWYFYRAGSKSFRIAMVFLISIINVYLHFLLARILYPSGHIVLSARIFFSEVFLTTVLTHTTFMNLKRCALKYFV